MGDIRESGNGPNRRGALSTPCGSNPFRPRSSSHGLQRKGPAAASPGVDELITFGFTGTLRDGARCAAVIGWFHVVSTDGSEIYEATASTCPCPATGECYHRAAVLMVTA